MRTLDLNLLPEDTKINFDLTCPHCKGEGELDRCDGCEDKAADCADGCTKETGHCEHCNQGYFEVMWNTAFAVHLRHFSSFDTLRLQAWDFGFCLIDLEGEHWLLMGMCGQDCTWIIHYTRWLLQGYLDMDDIHTLLGHWSAHVFLNAEERRKLCQYMETRIPTPLEYSKGYRRDMATLATIAASEER